MVNRRVRIKFCGITRLEDALRAVDLGVDAVGLVFYSKSARCVSLELAKKIRFALPPFVSVTALVVDESEAAIRHLMTTLSPDLIQFHGNESNAFCQSFGVPFIKAIRVRNPMQLQQSLLAFPAASGLLLDTYKPQQLGGTGSVFNWGWIPQKVDKPLILAGGLTSYNVQEALGQVAAYGVDVSSGIESAPGIKDAKLMRAFVSTLLKVSCSKG